MLSRVIMTLAGIAALSACAAQPPSPQSMAVSVAFGMRNYCGLGVSPAIAVSNPPPGTARYRVRMVNTEVMFPTPYETTVESAGPAIAEGAMADYPGPCPGEFQRPRYRFTVTAVDGGGRALASAENIQLIVPLSLLVQRNREGIEQAPVSPTTAATRQRRGGPSPVIEINPFDTVSNIPRARLYRDPTDDAFGAEPLSNLDPERATRANSIYSIY